MIQQTISRPDRQFLGAVRWCAVVVMMLTPQYGFWSTWLGTLVGPLWLWKASLDIIVAVLALLLIGWALLHRQTMRPIVGLAFVRLMIGFSTLALIVTSAVSVGGEQLAAGLAFGLRYILLFCIMFATSWLLGVGKAWRTMTQRYLVLVTLFLVGFGLLQVTVLPVDTLTQFGYGPGTIAPVSTIDNNPDARRAFATMRGPNDFGAFMIVLLAVACVMTMPRRQRYVVAAAAGLGLLVSGSRSAMLGGGIVVASALVLRYGRHVLRRRQAVAGIVVAAIVTVGLVIAATTIPELRLIVFHSSPGDTHLTEGSTDKHWQQTAMGLKAVVDRPLGCGLGCAGPASFYGEVPSISENYYVQIAEETGIVGLVLWGAIFVVVMRELYRLAQRDEIARMLFVSGLGITAVGFWLHVWADITLSLVWWGLAGLVIGNAMAKSHKTRYDTT
ncbi:MAG: O-antigen ligase family protein [Candidatus Saccharimonadales bacterium]